MEVGALRTLSLDVGTLPHAVRMAAENKINLDCILTYGVLILGTRSARATYFDHSLYPQSVRFELFSCCCVCP